jgi:dolichyl-phosphate-mannose-protein mannosyltransferase/tetratricopeptide repeat protein
LTEGAHDGPHGVAQQGAPAGAGLSGRARAVLFFLALVPRLVALAQLHGSPWLTVPLGDARFFDDWGQRVAAGEGGGEVFYQAPLYPYALGLVYALFGHVPGLVRALQCLLGALAAVWIGDGTSRLFGRRAGLAAGALAALYGPWIWYDLQLEKSALACALTAFLFWLALSPMPEGSAGRALGRALAAGMALGALTLLRENAAVLLVALAVAVGRAREGRGARLAALVGGFALVLAPVALRNRALGGAPLPTASNAGVNFYIGNGAEADGQYRPLIAGRGHPDHEREDATRIAQDMSGRALTPAEVSGFWFRLALSEMRAEPGHWLWLTAHKARLLAHRREIMDAVAFEVFQDGSWVLRVLGLVGFGLLLPLAVAGMVLAGRRGNAGLSLAAAGLLALSILAFFVVGRFRLGLVPLLAPFAGLALARLREEGAPRRGAALALAGLALLAAWWPLASSGDERATSAANLASELTRRGDFAGAERFAREARARDPRSADAAYNLGVALRQLGRNAEAVEPFEAAMALEPAYSADVLAELGALRALAGDAAGARALLERALALDPSHASARQYLTTLERSPRSE